MFLPIAPSINGSAPASKRKSLQRNAAHVFAERTLFAPTSTFPTRQLRKLPTARRYKGVLTLLWRYFLTTGARLPTNIPSRLDGACCFARVSFLFTSSHQACFASFWHFRLCRWLRLTCRRLPGALTWHVTSPSRSDLPPSECWS